MTDAFVVSGVRVTFDRADVDAAESERWDRLFRPAMREQGVLLTANQNEAQFVCAAHTEEDVERTLDAYAEAL